MRRLTVLLLLAGAASSQELGPFVMAGATEPPAAGVEITLWDATALHRFLGRGVTGEGGRFSIRVGADAVRRREHPYGSVIVVARCEGIAEHRARHPAGWSKCVVAVRPAMVVRGIVRDVEDQLLSGAVVRASPVHERALPSGLLVEEVTTANEKGEFTLERLGPAPLRLRIEVVGYAPVVEQTVGEGEVLEFDLVALRPTEKKPGDPFRGRVVDSAGEPVPRVRVSAHPPGHATWTDDDGRYLLRGIPPGMVRLVARHPGYLPTSLRVEAGKAADHLTLRLLRGGEVAGTVVRDGKPVLGARVSLRSGGAEVAFGFSDRKGRFLIRGVPARAREAVAWAPGARTPVVPVDGVAEGGRIGPLRLVLEERLRLHGVLSSDTGEPLSGVVVRSEAGEAITTADGEFDFGAVPARRHSIEAEPPDHAPVARGAWPGGKVDIVAESRLGTCVLQAHAVPSGVEGLMEIRRVGDPAVRRSGAIGKPFRHLPAGKYAVRLAAEGYLTQEDLVDLTDGVFIVRYRLVRTGSVRLEANPGAKVIVQTLAGRPAPATVLELAEGVVTLRGFGPGRYRFISRAPGELIVLRELALAPDDPPVTVDLRGGEAATLELKVEDSQGDPVAGARVFLETEGGFRWPAPRPTGADGTVTISRLVAGRLFVEIRKGESTATEAVDIVAGGTASLTARIR